MPDDPHNPPLKARAAVASSDAETVTFALPADTVAAASERYDILAELGRGGMGIVYKARDRETSEIVALKVLRPELAQDAKRMERFKGELRLARQITHKNACRTHELLRFGATAVISMEYVEGESLRQLMDRLGGVRVPKAIQIAREICAALHEAHAAGIVHRDLKPENVMLDRGGSAKVMDFGIARSAGETSDSVGITGTPAYMAPEQASGQPVDHRADIYALGLILYELVTGACAFTGETPVEIALKQVREMPPAPGDLDPGIPAHVERAILKCLAKSPDARFQSVDDLECALLQSSAPKLRTTELSLPSVAVALPARLTRWQRSDWVLLAAAIVGIAGYLLLFDRAYVSYAVIAAPYSRAEALERARALVAKYAPETKDVEWKAYFDAGWFMDAAGHGPVDAEIIRSARERMAGWSVSGIRERQAKAYVQFSAAGRPREVDFHLPAADANTVPVEVVRADATKFAQDIFGLDLANAPPIEYRFDEGLRRWIMGERYASFSQPQGTPVAWQLPSSGPYHDYIVVGMKQGRLSWGQIMTESRPGPAPRGRRSRLLDYWQTYGMLAGVIFSFLLLLVFFAKGLFRTTTWPMLVAAGIAAAGVTDVVYRIADRSNPEIAAIIALAVTLVLAYMISAVCYYYTERALPVQASSVRQLFRLQLPPESCGLSILRGACIGAAYLLLHGTVLIAAGRIGSSGGFSWIQTFIFPGAEGGGPDALWPFTFVMLPAIAATLLYTALPAALATRAGKSRRAAALVVAAVWTLTYGAALMGNTTSEAWATCLLVLIESLVFAGVLLHFDLLACFAAVLTVETGLVAVPIARIFWNDSLVYCAGVLYWAAFVIIGLAIFGRPNIVGFFRRVQAITK